MQPIEARRSERVHYRGVVELRADDGHEFDTVRAQALDLGPGGMRVATDIEMPVGARVRCGVTIDGREVALPGRIVWLAAHGERDHGMGICFDPLGERERELLQQMLERSRAGYRPVEVRFAGVEHPVRARARARTGGLRLSAALPILARGAELSFRLDAEGPVFKGRIADASLVDEDGARRLEVEVDVLDDDHVRFRRKTRYGYAEEIAADEHRRPHGADARTGAASATVPVQIPTRAPSRWRPLLVSAAIGALAGWLVGAHEPRGAARPRTNTARADALDAARAQNGRGQTAPTEQPETVAAAELVAAHAATQPLDLGRPTELEAASSEPHSTAPVRGVDVGAARTSTPVLPLTNQAGPQVLLDEEVARVLLPFEGSLERMHATLWAAPYALAITLPHGRVTLDEGSYRIRAAGLGDLRVLRRSKDQLVRLLLHTKLAHFTVASEDGVLELRLVREQAADANP